MIMDIDVIERLDIVGCEIYRGNWTAEKEDGALNRPELLGGLEAV